MFASTREAHLHPEEGLNLVPAFRDCLAPGILVVNDRGLIVSASSEICTWFGITVSSSSEGTSVEVLPAGLCDLLRKFFAQRTALTAVETTLAMGFQPPRKFRISALPLPRVNSELEVVLTLTDVTGLTRVQNSIERLDRLANIGTLSAGMAHEIKNALVAVKTFLDLLLEKNKDAELAELVGREMNRINSIVRQLLKFGGATRPVHGTVRLHDVLEHSLRMVKHQLDGKLISLKRSFEATHDAVQGDDHQLEQVFVNLFLNAVDATGANGSLTVQTEFVPEAPCEGEMPELAGQPLVRVTVADTGSGIPPELLDQMFEPFFTTKNNGTGLGLPISRRIVEEHRGLITVESQPNKGTTFQIILPAGVTAK